MGDYCEYKVKLQGKAERVDFIKTWSVFASKARLNTDDTPVFTPSTMASRSMCTGREPLWRASGAARSIARALGWIHAMKVEADALLVIFLFIIVLFVKFWL
jgi:hypothetical protein